jgi:hypothetical protein
MLKASKKYLQYFDKNVVTHPKMLDSVKNNLKRLQEDNPDHEVVGQLTVVSESEVESPVAQSEVAVESPVESPVAHSEVAVESPVAQSEVADKMLVVDESPIVSDYRVVAYGDDDKVAYREFHPFVFHTHPMGEFFSKEPPSGEDFLQALSWGYPDFNEKLESSTWELVIAPEGFYWYRASKGLKMLYCDLQTSNSLEEQHCLTKYIHLYINIAVVSLKNDIIQLDMFLKIIKTINGPWMSNFLQSNNELLQYLSKEFPLHSIEKLTDSEFSKYFHPGFDLIFEEYTCSR